MCGVLWVQERAWRGPGPLRGSAGPLKDSAEPPPRYLRAATVERAAGLRGAKAQARCRAARRLPGYGASASRRSSRAVASPLTRARCSTIRALGATRGRWRRCSLPSG